MPLVLRVFLFIVSVATTLYIQRKLKKSQMKVDDTVFWILFSATLIILSVFPKIAIWCAARMQIISPVNFVFLAMIFLLFVRCFLLDIKLSNLTEQFKNLVEELAVRENLQKKTTDAQKEGA